MKKIIIPAISLVLAFIFYACDTRTYDEISPSTLTYNAAIKPVLTSYCTSCHSAGGDFPDLTTYANVKENIDVVISEIESGNMPPSGPLPASTVTLFKNWKAAGMPEN